MKAGKISILMVAAVFGLILTMAHQPGFAASSEELKLMQPLWGNGILIPRLESTHGHDMLKLLYDPLVGTTPDGKLSPEHGLATKWEMTRDGLTWTFQLRKGVKFHDGVELTAKDVKFSLEQVMLTDSISEYASDIRKSIRLIEIKDPYTLIVHCKKPSIFFPTILSDMTSTDCFIIPKDYYERVGKDEFSKKPIGSGPYKFHSHVMGAYIKLEAVDKHWRDGVPAYKYVTFLMIPEESTRIAMLKTGEADIARISRDTVKDVSAAGLKVISKRDASVLIFHCNMQWATPAFSDIRFRKALNLALDRESIIKNILGGEGMPIAQYPGTHIFACGGDPNLKPYPYDPQEARRLIKEGGYEGYEFTLVSYQRPGLPELSQVVETVVGYWQKVGLKPKIAMSDWTRFRESWRAKKIQNTAAGYDTTLNPECGSILSRTEEKYSSSEPRNVIQDPKMDEWYKKASSTLDMGELARILGEVYRYSYDQHYIVPICMINDKIATTKRIPDWDPGRRRTDRNINAIIKQR